ncbi:MAG: hypothetical protein M1546_06830 [Chloroflexi bacterium]|nr:hypothetical protein [Chloroflexota bacterium]
MQQIEAAVLRLPLQRRKQVLLFVEFLEYLTEREQGLDRLDDEDLWAAVIAHQAYREAHPDEQPEVFDSAEDFLRATADL